jgi:hypothetical protein
LAGNSQKSKPQTATAALCSIQKRRLAGKPKISAKNQERKNYCVSVVIRKEFPHSQDPFPTLAPQQKAYAFWEFADIVRLFFNAAA